MKLFKPGGLGAGGGSSNYKMTHVPLKIGVKINPDNGLYTADSTKTYKERAMYLMTEKIREEYDEMEDAEKFAMERNPNHRQSASDYARVAKNALSVIKKAVKFEVNM